MRVAMTATIVSRVRGNTDMGQIADCVSNWLISRFSLASARSSSPQLVAWGWWIRCILRYSNSTLILFISSVHAVPDLSGVKIGLWSTVALLLEKINITTSQLALWSTWLKKKYYQSTWMQWIAAILIWQHCTSHTQIRWLSWSQCVRPVTPSIEK